MSDTTPPVVETVTPPVVKNDVTPPVQPPVVKTEDNSAVEELKKQLAQQEMRANQLANQLKTKEEAEASAKDKELEEQNQFKSLYEQEKTKREAIEAERQEQEQRAELDKAKHEVLSKYSDEVRELAEEAGMDLSAADETAVNSFREKLDKIDARLASSGKIKPSNPSNPNTNIELSGDELRTALQDDNAFHELVTSKFPGIASMTKQR